MADFNEIFSAIHTGVRDLAQVTVSNYLNDAISDSEDFLHRVSDRLERWTALLATGQLTPDEFEYLVRSQAALAEMRALKLSGLALIRVDEFKASLLNLVTDTVFKFVLP